MADASTSAWPGDISNVSTTASCTLPSSSHGSSMISDSQGTTASASSSMTSVSSLGEPLAFEANNHAKPLSTSQLEVISKHAASAHAGSQEAVMLQALLGHIQTLSGHQATSRQTTITRASEEATSHLSEKARGKRKATADDIDDCECEAVNEPPTPPPLHLSFAFTKPSTLQATFAELEHDKTMLENEQLRRQARLLARGHRPSGSIEEKKLLEQVSQLRHERNWLYNQLEYSEAAGERLARELQGLRSFLLNSITVLPDPRADLPDPHHHHAFTPGRVFPKVEEDEASQRLGHLDEPIVLESDESGAAPDMELRTRRSPDRNASPEHRSRPTRPKKRQPTMGDAETEFLLSMASRLTRVYKAFDRPSGQYAATTANDHVPIRSRPLYPHQQARPTYRQQQTETPPDSKPTSAKRSKIGRPLGSPNKTKTVAINASAAARRRQHKRERQRRLGGSTSGHMGDLLAAAEQAIEDDSDGSEDSNDEHGGDYEGWAEDGADEEWPKSIQQEMDDGATTEREEDAAHDTEAENEDEVEYLPRPTRRRGVSHGSPLARAAPKTPRLSRSVPGMHGRTLSRSGPDMPIPGLDDSILQTPDTIDRQLSGLDVLADQAASASQGPARTGMHASTTYGRSAGENFQAILGANQGVRDGATVPADNSAPHHAIIQTLPASSSSSDAGARAMHTSGLGDAFSYTPAGPSIPNRIFSDEQLSSTYRSPYGFSSGQSPGTGAPAPVESFGTAADASGSHSAQSQASRAIQLTIAQQLAAGVDAAHPLIDPSDLSSGMTPAAALAKKSRSPYIKWTSDEDALLVKGVAKHGTRWDLVAKELPERSYHQCRQRWLRGLKSGDNLPKDLQYLKPQIDSAIAAYDAARPQPKVKQQQD